MQEQEHEPSDGGAPVVQRIRVAVWGTGGTGRPGLRGVLAHPGLELVAVRVTDPAKVGRDAADLCGWPEPTGVVAVDDTDAVLAAEPQCLAYFGPGAGRELAVADDVVPFLRAGIDVVTTSLSSLTHPPSAPPAVRAPFAEAAEAGGATLFATGIEPGFASDVLPAALLAACDEVDTIVIQEIADYSSYPVADVMRHVFGFGGPLDSQPILALPGILAGAWAGIVHGVAEAIGLGLDAVDEVFDVAPAPRELETAVGTIEAGSIGGVRFQVRGLVDGRPRVVLEHVNRMDAAVAPEWPHAVASDRLAYRVEITGRPTMHCELVFPVDHRREGGDDHGLVATALRAVNAIPAVAEQPPGLVSGLDIPLARRPRAGSSR